MALAACSGDSFDASDPATNGGAAGATATAGSAGTGTVGGAGGGSTAGTGGGEISAGASGSGTSGAAGESAGASGGGASGAAGTGTGGSTSTGGNAGAGGGGASAGSGGSGLAAGTGGASDGGAAGNPATGGTAGNATGGASGGGGEAGGGGSPLTGPHVVFVRSQPVKGTAIGGLDGADALCTKAAESATPAEGKVNLKGRAWRAWLSTKDVAARDRITPQTGVFPEYRLVGGATVFAQGTLIGDSKNPAHPLEPLDQDERGLVPSNVYLWTGTTEAGTSSGSDCDAWGGLLATTLVGGVGKWASTESGWTADNVQKCTESAHLLCFEVRF